ncbi:hypothetical protein FRC03_007101 [Tulasnella sp. 419]|nr:hypothetical protein FRC03_007101 [Tulasnella sp. 419]
MLVRLGNTLEFKAEVVHSVPVEDEIWMRRGLFFNIETTLPGSFVLMATDDHSTHLLPYLTEIQEAFQMHFRTSVKRWITERMSKEGAAKDSFIMELRTKLKGLR